MSQIIDLHSHWFSPRSVELLKARGHAPRIVDESGAPSLQRTGPGVSGPPFALGPQWFDIDLRLAHLDKAGVAHQLISWPTTLGVDPALEAEDSLPLWRAWNDDLSQLVARHPRRFSGLAALSTSDIAWSVRELARSHDELGLIGGTLPVNGLASLAGARTFAPLFAEAQRRRSHIYLHTGYAHATVPGQPAPGLHADATAIRGTLDTSWHFAATVITLAFTDFLDTYPDVTVQVAMLGGSGVIGLVAEQVMLAAERYGVSDPASRFERIWLDTGAAGRGPQAIAMAANVLGADRIVFGSDFAPMPSIRPTIDNVLAAPITAAQRQAIFTNNGRKLLHAKGVDLEPLQTSGSRMAPDS
jgi:predicted TIM-barrel fold metal-dependent hydrolase